MCYDSAGVDGEQWSTSMDTAELKAGGRMYLERTRSGPLSDEGFVRRYQIRYTDPRPSSFTEVTGRPSFFFKAPEIMPRML